MYEFLTAMGIGAFVGAVAYYFFASRADKAHALHENASALGLSPEGDGLAGAHEGLAVAIRYDDGDEDTTLFSVHVGDWLPPGFILEPESAATTIATATGLMDDAADGPTEFGRAFLVTADDEDAIDVWLTNAPRDEILSLYARYPRMTILEGRLLVRRPGRIEDAEELREVLDALAELGADLRRRA